MLAISYAFYLNDGGLINYSNINNKFWYGGDGKTGKTIVGNNGYATFSDKVSATSELGAGKGKASFIFTDYAPTVITPYNKKASFLKISSESHSFGIKSKYESSLSDPYIYLFMDSANFSISSYDKTDINYSATLSVTVPNSNSVKIEITRNGEKRTLIDTSDSSIRKQWLPMQFDDSKYELHNKEYGWWED